MVQELSVLHEHEGVASVEVRDVGVDHDRHEAGARQGVPAQGPEPRAGDGFKSLKTVTFLNLILQGKA